MTPFNHTLCLLVIRIDIEFVKPSDINLSYPPLSVCTNPSETAMYDIDIDYTQTSGIDSSYLPPSLHNNPSEISMHDIELSHESPSMHVEHDNVIDYVTHCETEMNCPEIPVHDQQTVQDLIVENEPVPLVTEIRAEIHEEPRSTGDFQVKNPK